MDAQTLDLLRRNVATGAFAVMIEHADGDLHFVTGGRRLEFDGNTYVSREMSVPTLRLTTEVSTSRLIVSDSPDEAVSLERLHYQSRFSGGLLWWRFFRWEDDGTGWRTVLDYPWTIKQCTKNEREPTFEFLLTGATGTVPRAGLETVGRACGLTFGDALCLKGGPKPPYQTCDGSIQQCVERGRTDSFRGAIMCPEPGEEIEFYQRSYTIYPSSYPPNIPTGGGEPPPTTPDHPEIPVPEAEY